MIFRRIIWGIILAVLLGFSFYRAWTWEHGAEAHGADSHVLFAKKYGVETFVLIPPTVLFWILLVFLILYVFIYGIQKGLFHFTVLAMEVLLFLCVYFVLLLLVLPMLRKKFSARSCAILWLIPALLFWQGSRLVIAEPLPRLLIYIPGSFFPIIEMIWLAGFLAVLGYYVITHIIFCRQVKRQAENVLDEEMRILLEHEQEAMNYRRKVTVLRGNVSAPFSMGQTKRSRCIVLPDRNFTTEELTMIFRHELHHLQRMDIDTKIFLCLCNALCWFNPLVWIATQKAAQDLERSCDEIVTEDMSESERQTYAKLLLETAAPGRGLTTCLSSAAKTLRYRLKSVLNRQTHLLGTCMLMIVLFISVMCFGMISVSDAHGSFTSVLLTAGTEIQDIRDYHHIYHNSNDTSPDEGSVTSLETGADYTALWSKADIDEWDDAALREVLDKIHLEHITGPRTMSDDIQIVYYLSDGRIVYLYTNALTVSIPHQKNSEAENCYLIKGDIDWDALAACYKQTSQRNSG